MNKFKSDISSKLNKQVSKTTTSVNSKNDTGLLMPPLDTRSTSLKNVQAAAAAALSTAPFKNLKPKDMALTSIQQQQVKKKRTALENISNASISSTNMNTSTCSNTSQIGKNEITKKSRFGSINPVFGNGVSTQAQTNLKKSESTTCPKKKEIINSKENLSTLAAPSVGFKKHIPTSINKPAFCVTKHHTNLSTVTSVTTSSTSIKVEKYEKKDEKYSQESMIPVSKSDSSLASTEVQIERQLASTTISTSSSTLSMQSPSLSQLNLESTEDLSTVVETNKSTAESVEDWEDIDANDEGDEFNASDYVAYIFKYYREREDKFHVDDYIKQQPHITKHMRLLLVDWMVEVQQQLEFNHEVLYLSVKLLDLYLNSKRIEKERLQLLGGAAMFIACKFEERMPPIIDDFIFVSDNAYDRKDLIKMEIEILKTVRFDIGIPLSYTFLRRYSKCIKADMRFLTLARYILELSLQDYAFAALRDSLKACAALYLALKMTVRYEKGVKAAHTKANEIELAKGHPIKSEPTLTVSSANLTSTEWNSTLIHYTGSFVNEFIDYVPLMNKLLQTAALSKYKTIFKKYSHQVFYEVAKIAPLPEAEIEALVRNGHQSGNTNKHN